MCLFRFQGRNELHKWGVTSHVGLAGMCMSLQTSASLFNRTSIQPWDMSMWNGVTNMKRGSNTDSCLPIQKRKYIIIITEIIIIISVLSPLNNLISSLFCHQDPVEGTLDGNNKSDNESRMLFIEENKKVLTWHAKVYSSHKRMLSFMREAKYYEQRSRGVIVIIIMMTMMLLDSVIWVPGKNASW